MVALTKGPGERTRLACWRSRPRDRELFVQLGVSPDARAQEKIVSPRRRNQNARRVRYPISTNARSRCDSSTQEENSHPHSESVRHLIQDDTLQAVGDFAVNLDP